MDEQSVDISLRAYVERAILPRYEAFDPAHREDHARMVIRRSLQFGAPYRLDAAMLYTAAAYHDTGLVEGRQYHHVASARILAGDATLRRWFSQRQIATMARAVEDHRASAQRPPRSIYGKVIAEADRLIDLELTLRRTVQYGLTHEPQLDRSGQYARFYGHLTEKYGRKGYLRLWLEDTDNARGLEALRSLIDDEPGLRRAFDALYDAACALVRRPNT